MGRLTTHVLDTARGLPAEGIKIELFDGTGNGAPIAVSVTNADGRCDAALLEGDSFLTGEYQLVFHAGPYLNQSQPAAATPSFLDKIVIRFGVNDAQQHYHVPLLLSPFGYSTYRGS